MLKRMMILAACLVVLNSCNDYEAPKSWTIRCDHDATGGCSPIVKRLLPADECASRSPPPIDCKEVLTVDQFIQMIKKNEDKSFGIALTPEGAQSISDEIKSCHIDLESCRKGK